MYYSKILTGFIYIMLFCSVSPASNGLTIQDPQSWWRYGQGTIEQAVISVRPQGLYMECGLYLTISGRDLGFNAWDAMEIIYYFDLPAEAVVHDSWLWIGDEIIRGRLYDKWTAASIYEDIVNRRRDPSILFKNSATQYELRIYPMAGNESRKIKIHFLLPADWSSNAVSCALPVRMLNVSRNPLNTFYVLTWKNDEWKNPKMAEFPDVAFKALEDEQFGHYLRADIPVQATQASLNFSLNAPYRNGVYLSAFSGENENYYQLAFLPSQLTDLQNVSKKVAFLFDHLSLKSDYQPSEILSYVKQTLQADFSSRDSFNLIFTNLDIQRVSNSWLAADSQVIENTFAALNNNTLSSYSSLPALLSNGINFIQENGNNGSIFLLSSSDQLGESTVANDLIDDLLAKMNPLLPVHIMDYANWNAQYYYFGGRSYRGNEYFFNNISRLTSGNYVSTRSGKSLGQAITELSHALGSFISTFDLHTTLEDGFCYGRFDLSAGQTVYLNRPLKQIGKYNGQFPFRLEMAGEFNNKPFSVSMPVPAEHIFAGDSLSEELWLGTYIRTLEKEPQSNDIVSEIVNYSLQGRVLSLYTAFLCLEPERGGEICYDCMDESSLISDLFDAALAENDSLLSIYPNPFNSQATIEINLAALKDRDNLSLSIYNIAGQRVKTFETAKTSSGKLNLLWDGRNNQGAALSSGTYFFVAHGKQARLVRKLMLIK